MAAYKSLLLLWIHVVVLSGLFILSAAKKASQSSSTSSSATLDVEHSFESAEYVKRGVVSVQSLRTPQGQNVKFEQSPLTTEDFARLKVAAGEGSLYRVRTRSRFSLVEGSTEDEENYVYGSIPACLLIESGLKDHLFIHTDDAGAVVGVAITANASQCSHSEKKLLKAFTTVVQVSNGELGPAPEVEGFVRKVTAAKEKEQSTDNRSFLQKYWMYIAIGLVMYSLLNAGTSLASQQGGGGGGDGGGAS